MSGNAPPTPQIPQEESNVVVDHQQPPPEYMGEPVLAGPVAGLPMVDAEGDIPRPPCPGFWHNRVEHPHEEDLCNDCLIRNTIDICDEAVLRLNDQFGTLSNNLQAFSANLHDETLPYFDGRIAALERDRVTPNHVSMALGRFDDYVKDLVNNTAGDVRAALVAEQERMQREITFNRAQITALVNDAGMNDDILAMIGGSMDIMVRRVTAIETWVCNLYFVRLSLALKSFCEGVAHRVLYPALRMARRIPVALTSATWLPFMISLTFIGFAVPLVINHIHPATPSSIYVSSVTTVAILLVIDRIYLLVLQAA